MADSKRQTRSTRRREQQTDAQFWSNQPDPLLIERGQADAIPLVRSSINPASGIATASEPMGKQMQQMYPGYPKWCLLTMKV